MKATLNPADRMTSGITSRSDVISSKLNNLNPDMARSRILTSEEAAEFWGVSVSHWRRLYRSGKAPRPIRIGVRKLGWRIGDLAELLEELSVQEKWS